MSIAATYIVDNTPTTYKSFIKSTTTKTESTNDFKDAIQESTVDVFKRRHPDHARHVEQQVRAGRAVRKKNGATNVATKEMTMEEYKAYFTALLDTIPYDSTRVNDVTTISISEKGWEQMKKDPDYEAWVLGYFVEDRSVRNPFFGWGNNDGIICLEHFGASIEEHHGEGFNKAAFKNDKPDKDDEEEEDWWIKRHKRMKKLLKEQVERTMKKDAAQKYALREEYARQQYLSSQRQHSFLTSGTPDSNTAPMTEGTATSIAVAAYTGTLDLFCNNITH